MDQTNLDLHAISGLPLALDAQGKLVLSADVKVKEYRARTFAELTAVYLARTACSADTIAYEMFNDLYLNEDCEWVKKLPVRYELTLFPDLKIGPEYVKTLGHIHLKDPRSGIDHPEICEVLVGKAHFLFMKLDLEQRSASSAFYVEVTAGQKIIIPPGYDHLTINPGPGPMLFSDVVSREVGGNYDRMKAMGGAVYLEVDRHGMPEFIPNPSYTSHPPLQRFSPREFPELNLTKGEPLYTAFRRNQAREWDFLIWPERFAGQFPNLSALFQAA